MPSLEGAPLVPPHPPLPQGALLISKVPQAAHVSLHVHMSTRAAQLHTACAHACQAAPCARVHTHTRCGCTSMSSPPPARPRPCMHIACLLWSPRLAHAGSPPRDPFLRLHARVLRGKPWAAGAQKGEKPATGSDPRVRDSPLPAPWGCVCVNSVCVCTCVSVRMTMCACEHIGMCLFASGRGCPCVPRQPVARFHPNL